MNLVSLLILPAVIRMGDSPVRFAVAGAAVVVLGVAIAFSKRRTHSLDAEIDLSAPEPELTPTGVR
jgi:hypothetical protein